MRQTVKVLALNGRFCTVGMHRESACGGNCHSCGGCSSPSDSFEALAENLAGARPGDTVLVETNSGSVFGIAALVYLLPIVLLFAGYLAAAVLFDHPALPGIFSGIGFVLGLLIIVVYGRGAGNRVRLSVVEILRKSAPDPDENEQDVNFSH